MGPGFYLVVDLEATCSDDETVPRDEMEIIEVGAVVTSGATFAPVDEFQSFVKPVRHPTLTPYCTNLTSIGQEDVDRARSFLEVARSFEEFLTEYRGFVFGSWGNYDISQIRQDCEYHHVPYPIPGPHVNLKNLFSEKQGLSKQLGVSKAMRRAGLEFQGAQHRGIDDARNIARLLPYIFGDLAIVPTNKHGRHAGRLAS